MEYYRAYAFKLDAIFIGRIIIIVIIIEISFQYACEELKKMRQTAESIFNMRLGDITDSVYFYTGDSTDSVYILCATESLHPGIRRGNFLTGNFLVEYFAWMKFRIHSIRSHNLGNSIIIL